MSSSIRRNTGRWTEDEHKNFLRGLEQLGKNWDAIRELYVQTRNETQIRTHAQKFFQKASQGRPFPEEPYKSANAGASANTGTAAQGGGNEDEGDGKNAYYSNDAPLGPAAFAEEHSQFVGPPSTAAAAAAAAAAGAGSGHAGYANRGIPAEDYAYMSSPFQAAHPPFPGADMMIPASPDFGANPMLSNELHSWHAQMPLEAMGGGMAGGFGGAAAAAEPGSGPQFGRHAAGSGRTEDDLLRAVAEMDGYDSDISFSHFDTRSGSPASWTGYSAGGTMH